MVLAQSAPVIVGSAYAALQNVPYSIDQDSGPGFRYSSARMGVCRPTNTISVDNIDLADVQMPSADAMALQYFSTWGHHYDKSGLSNALRDTAYSIFDPPMDLALAEPDSDVVPTSADAPDTMADNIESAITGSDQRNTGGIGEAHIGGIGASDGEAFGPDIQNGDDFGLGLAELFDLPEPDEQQEIDNADSANINGGDSAPLHLEKMDTSGDIGTDTAVKSSAFEAQSRGVSAFQSSNNAGGGGGANGAGNMTLERADMFFNIFKKNVTTQSALRQSSFNKLKNIQSELMSIDNIVYIKDSMLTPDEFRNKLESRIHSIMGLQKQIMSAALKMQDKNNVYYHSAVALDTICDNSLVLLHYLYKHPEKKSVLNHIKSFISNALLEVSHNITTLHESLENNDLDHISELVSMMESWQNAKRDEENMSRILKIDVASSTSNSDYTQYMRKDINDTVNQTLMLLRKSDQSLNAVTMSSYAGVKSSINSRKLKMASKQSAETISKNTNNILQKYPTVPAGSKMFARRLNALETPLAADKNRSIYVRQYEATKRFFQK
jgi:hypothetical protein